MPSSPEAHDKNVELPRSITLELPFDAIADAALLANLMRYKNPNEGFVELIKTSWRFHDQFPHEPEFIVVHPNGQTEHSGDLLKQINQTDSNQELKAFSLQIPEKIAQKLDERVWHNEITFQEAAKSFFDEGRLIQKVLLSGGKVLLSNGRNTGYNFLSLREEGILVVRKILHRK